MSTSTTRNTSSRRSFLQKMALTGLAAGPGSAFLASCASGGGDDDEGDEEAGETSADNPFGVKDDSEVEIWIFDGGFTDAYAVDVHEPILQDAYPDITIDHHKAVDIAGELQQRFVGGNPPDFVNNSGDGQMNLTKLVADEQVADLTPLFDGPSWDDPDTKVRDLLAPGTIELGTFDGVPRVLNYAYTVYGLWINKTMFDENGWNTQPATWDEMLDLCDDIKSAGIAPWVYQGETAPRYMHEPILTTAIKHAGPEIMIDVDNLEPGAWKQDAILQAADYIYQLAENKYFMPGIEGMDFRDVQALWAQGEAAICPSGSWLENEEKDTIAEDPNFEMAYMLIPLIEEGGAMPLESMRSAPSEPYLIPEDAPNKAGGMEYMRAMLSKDGAEGFANAVSSLTSLAVDIQIESPGLASAKAAFDASGDNVWNWFYGTWYTEMENPGIDQVTRRLLLAEINAEQWADECEKIATKFREDDSIPKQTREA